MPEEKLYTLKLNGEIVGQHDGKLDASMSYEWRDLDYMELCALESALLNAITKALTDLGQAGIELLGKAKK